jgi:hypothetical protein
LIPILTAGKAKTKDVPGDTSVMKRYWTYLYFATCLYGTKQRNLTRRTAITVAMAIGTLEIVLGQDTT